VVNVEHHEVRGLTWAFAYNFCLFSSYYILRPVRDAMGIAGGVGNLQWLFLATFAAMLAVVPLFGWLTSHVPRRRFLPYAYGFFVANLLVFFALFRSDVAHVHVARAFFVWLSVFNLFVVSVFWSFMTDLFDDGQSKRLFGLIAAGGTAGALTGPAIAGGLANVVGVTNLLLFSAVLLLAVVPCIRGLANWSSSLRGEGPGSFGRGRARVASAASRPDDDDTVLGGGLWAGIQLVLRSRYLLGICALILLYTTLSTFLYFQQAHIVEAAFDDAAGRTAVFAGMDFAVNALTLTLQTLLTGRIVRMLGLARALALVPLGLMVGFGAIAAAPVLAVLVSVQVLRRAGDYALMKPAREMLFVVVTRDEKYKAKNFIDTAVYRGGDALSAWAFAGIRALGLSLAQTALVAVPLAGIWAWLAFRLGETRDRSAGGARTGVTKHPHDRHREVPDPARRTTA
jgi:AAA family ATP:ADP antiporter